MTVVLQFLQDNWGDLSSVLGVVVSTVGLVWAVRVAGGARSAAQEAEKAARKTTDRIGREMVVADLASAVALIQRLKLLHRDARWDAALEQYQALRSMLASILYRHTDMETVRRNQLVEARTQVSVMEQLIEQYPTKDVPEAYRMTFNEQLNRIQTALEDVESSLGLSS